MTLEESVIICGAIVEEQHHLVVFIKYVCAVDILFHMGIILRFHMGVADIILRFHPETKSLRLLQNFYAGWISNKFSSFRYYISLVCLFELKKYGLFLLKMLPLPCVIFTSRETCRSVLRV